MCDNFVNGLGQRWCDSCNGSVVVRQTWRAHGRKDKPDSPKQPDAIVPELVSVDPEADEDDPMLQHGELLFCNRAPGEEYTPSDDDSSEEEDPLGLQQQVSESSRVGRGRLSAAEVTLFLLDWMCSHKQTDKAARDIWSLCQLLLPGQVDIPTFTQVKKLLVVPHTPLS